MLCFSIHRWPLSLSPVCERGATAHDACLAATVASHTNQAVAAAAAVQPSQSNNLMVYTERSAACTITMGHGTQRKGRCPIRQLRFSGFLTHTHTHNLVTEAEMELIAQIEIKISEECRSTSLTASVK